MNNDIKNIAIVRLSALGDIVNTAVVLQFIKKHYPNIRITWVCEEVFAPLLEEHPLLDTLHSVNIKKLKKEKTLSLLKQTIRSLQLLGTFDIIIDVQGLLKSAIVARLMGKDTHGYDKDSSRESLSSFFYKTTSHIAYDENIVKRNTFLVADALGFEINDTMLLNKKPVFPVHKQSLSHNKKNVAVVIGASWQSKKYPKEKVAQLCNELQQYCHIIWGNDAEEQEAIWICEHSCYASLTPKFSLKELISFISSVDLLIGNDTGPTHMAWAQNIPSITLFGPTTSRMIYETSQNISIKSPSEVNIHKINKNDFSIQKIEVQEIVHKAKGLLQ